MRDLIFPFTFRISTGPPGDIEAIRAALPESAREAYTFQIEASNFNLDAYFTHMTRRTLGNFARDAQNGVQFLDSHNNRNLGYGRTYGGQVKLDSERQPVFNVPEGVELAIQPPSQYAYALLSVFTIPGIRFGGGLTYASTDDFIKAVDTGLAVDTSVGFYGGMWRCDICGNNYLDYRACQHFAGRVYAIGENGARQVLATVTVDGANLAEVSAVYDGATPNASILKAREMAEDGTLDQETKRFLEVRYQVDLPAGRIYPVTKVSNGGERRMDLEEAIKQIRNVLAETGVPTTAELPEQVRWLVSENVRLRTAAADGEQYRNDLIAQALAEGVRALGETFNQEAYRGMLGQSSIETIKRVRDDWKALGDKRFPGGRQVHETDEKEVRRAAVPDSAYRS